MAISDALKNSPYGPMGGPLDALMMHVKRSVNGKEYSIEELKEYVKTHKKEFSGENVKSRLSKMLEHMSESELAQQKDIGLLVPLQQKGNQMVIVGNPLYMAIYLREEALIRGMCEKQVPLVGAECIFLRGKSFEDAEEAENKAKAIAAVLLENVANLSEELWVLLWEYYAKQPEQTKKGLQLGNTAGKTVQDLLCWEKNLLNLKNKHPMVYKEAVTEELFNKILLACCRIETEQAVSEEERKELSGNIRKLNYPLGNSQLLWKQIVELEKTNPNSSFYNCWEYGKKYMKLWKKLSGQPLIAELQGDLKECFENALSVDADIFGNFINGSCFVGSVLETVDMVKYSENLKTSTVFQYFIKEDREEELLGALRISLISNGMLSKAFRYAEEHNQSWAMPLFMLKQHGEWTPEARYDV